MEILHVEMPEFAQRFCVNTIPHSEEFFWRHVSGLSADRVAVHDEKDVCADVQDQSIVSSHFWVAPSDLAASLRRLGIEVFACERFAQFLDPVFLSLVCGLFFFS